MGWGGGGGVTDGEIRTVEGLAQPGGEREGRIRLNTVHIFNHRLDLNKG
jgi:hypothetical protein